MDAGCHLKKYSRGQNRNTTTVSHSHTSFVISVCVVLLAVSFTGIHVADLLGVLEAEEDKVKSETGRPGDRGG